MSFMKFQRCFNLFQIVMQHRGIEKIRGCQKNYIVAVGVIPEFCKNVRFYIILKV